MKRYKKLFETKKAFIPFFTLGDPAMGESLELIKAAIDSGADALEIGLPFSDPIADGPVIQASSERALNAGATFEKCVATLKAIRDYSDIPVGVMLYYNVLFKQGEAAYEKLQHAGVDALLVVDLPIEESKAHEDLCHKYDLGVIQLLAPNTSVERAKELLSRTNAFAYVISRRGTTGDQVKMGGDLKQRLTELKKLSDVPLVVGFGISDASHVKSVYDAGGDGAIIGSAIVKLIEKNCGSFADMKDAVTRFIKEIQN